MSTMSYIKKYLSEDLWEFASQFKIPEDFIIDMPKLIEMLLRSKSIDKKEDKQNWLNLLPLMDSNQINKLKAILEKEQDKLKEIEDKYEKKKLDIKKKYLIKWQQMWYVTKVTQIREEEEQTKSADDKEADRLLDMI